jgi:hypothetical protein
LAIIVAAFAFALGIVLLIAYLRIERRSAESAASLREDLATYLALRGQRHSKGLRRPPFGSPGQR